MCVREVQAHSVLQSIYGVVLELGLDESIEVVWDVVASIYTRV